MELPAVTDRVDRALGRVGRLGLGELVELVELVGLVELQGKEAAGLGLANGRSVR